MAHRRYPPPPDMPLLAEWLPYALHSPTLPLSPWSKQHVTSSRKKKKPFSQWCFSVGCISIATILFSGRLGVTNRPVIFRRIS